MKLLCKAHYTCTISSTNRNKCIDVATDLHRTAKRPSISTALFIKMQTKGNKIDNQHIIWIFSSHFLLYRLNRTKKRHNESQNQVQNSANKRQS